MRETGKRSDVLGMIVAVIQPSLIAVLIWTILSGLAIAPASAQTPLTSLANEDVPFTVSDEGFHVLKRGDVTAIVVDNRAIKNGLIPDHRAGYSGIASLRHRLSDRNLFVPAYAGLNFEHIHDGTTRARDILFEPRRASMELRVIDEFTVELYQPPTPNWKLESVTRYAILEDGTIEMTFECIPREATFKNDYIGMFWASYIDKPESLDIHFPGRLTDSDEEPTWIQGVTPSHGVQSTHVGIHDEREFKRDADFPLTLVFNRSDYRFAEPWYYAVSHEMALVQMFRPQDKIRLSQSPSGGGQGNPAWDFQWFVDDCEVGKRYQMIMRAQYIPFESHAQVIAETAANRAALEH